MAIIRYNLGPMDNNSYLIVDDATQEAAMVDPSFDSESLIPEIREAGYKLKYLLNTHAHFDHVIGNKVYAEEFGIPLALHRDDLKILHALLEQGKRYNIKVEPSPEPDIFLEEGQDLMLGETMIRVLNTPGHSPGSVTFLLDNVAIVGDVLFAGSVGRTDFPGCSSEALLHSIRTKLLILPDETQVLPGHGEATTIGHERTTNPFLRDRKRAKEQAS